MKKTLFFFMLICMNIGLYGQEGIVSYGYDAAGNRISRVTTIILPKEDDSNNKSLNSIKDSFGEGSITIAPNPTDGILYVLFKDIEITDQTEIELYDISGKLVLKRTVRSDREELDFKSSPSGSYILKLTNGENRIEYVVIKE